MSSPTNNHSMLTRSKSRNNFNESAEQTGNTQPSTVIPDDTDNVFNKINRKIDKFNIWVSTSLIAMMVVMFGVTMIVEICEYITYLEETYWFETSQETYHIILNTACALNLIMACVIGRILWLYEEKEDDLRLCAINTPTLSAVSRREEQRVEDCAFQIHNGEKQTKILNNQQYNDIAHTDANVDTYYIDESPHINDYTP